MLSRVFRNCAVAVGLLGMLGAGSAYAVAGVTGRPDPAAAATRSNLTTAAGHLPGVPGLSTPDRSTAGPAGGAVGAARTAGTGANASGAGRSLTDVGQLLSGVQAPVTSTGIRGTTPSTDSSKGGVQRPGTSGSDHEGALGAVAPELSRVTGSTVAGLSGLGLGLPSVVPSR
ncbi:MAG TPA: hypothetical protein VIR27_00580 [Mycobacteriales bacterium]